MSNFDFSSLNDGQIDALRSQLRDFISGTKDVASFGLVENLAGHASGTGHGNAVAGHASGTGHGNAVAGHASGTGHGNAVARHGNA